MTRIERLDNIVYHLITTGSFPVEPFDPKQIVTIAFVNHRGEFHSGRKILPFPGTLRFGADEWHREPCWKFDAHCFTRKATRTFAVHGIRSWKETPMEELPS